MIITIGINKESHTHTNRQKDRQIDEITDRQKEMDRQRQTDTTAHVIKQNIMIYITRESFESI